MNALPGLPSRMSDRARPASRDNAERAAAAATLGPWRLTAILHRGGSCHLFRARPAADAHGCGCYAIKVCAPGSNLRQSLAMLRRERAVAESVQHPQVVSLLSEHLSGESPFLVFPLLEGLSLDRLIQRKPAHRLPIAVALWISRQIAEGLAALHSAGWLHGQVRPDHVVVSPQGHATLIDLALARRLRSAECQLAIESNVPRYAAPESFAARSTLMAASDTYCLGLVLFELVAGQHPFDQERDRMSLADAHRGAAPADVRTLRPEAPHEVANLLSRMLAKEPLRRPDDEQLIRWLTELEIELLGR